MEPHRVRCTRVGVHCRLHCVRGAQAVSAARDCQHIVRCALCSHTAAAAAPCCRRDPAAAATVAAATADKLRARTAGLLRDDGRRGLPFNQAPDNASAPLLNMSNNARVLPPTQLRCVRRALSCALHAAAAVQHAPARSSALALLPTPHTTRRCRCLQGCWAGGDQPKPWPAGGRHRVSSRAQPARCRGDSQVAGHGRRGRLPVCAQVRRAGGARACA